MYNQFTLHLDPNRSLDIDRPEGERWNHLYLTPEEMIQSMVTYVVDHSCAGNEFHSLYGNDGEYYDIGALSPNGYSYDDGQGTDKYDFFIWNKQKKVYVSDMSWKNCPSMVTLLMKTVPNPSEWKIRREQNV